VWLGPRAGASQKSVSKCWHEIRLTPDLLCRLIDPHPDILMPMLAREVVYRGCTPSAGIHALGISSTVARVNKLSNQDES
jgi:hypothetical protein